MFFSSSSSSFSSEDGSELSSDRSSAIFEESEASFVPHDEDLEPLATQEEAAAYKANHENQDSRFFFFLPIIHEWLKLKQKF